MSTLTHRPHPTACRTDPQSWPVERQVSLVLEGLRSYRPVTEICRQAGIPTSRSYRWRDQFLKAGREGLAQSDTERQQMEERIHELEAENEVLRIEKEIFQEICLED